MSTTRNGGRNGFSELWGLKTELVSVIVPPGLKVVNSVSTNPGASSAVMIQVPTTLPSSSSSAFAFEASVKPNKADAKK